MNRIALMSALVLSAGVADSAAADPPTQIPHDLKCSVAATLGRDVHVYCPTKWIGPRAGKVVGCEELMNGRQFVSVHVWLNPAQDTDGGTADMIDIPLVDTQPPQARQKLPDEGWAEWPPILGGSVRAPLNAAASTSPVPPITVNVGDIAGKLHDSWLNQADRSYSPFNKPWTALSSPAKASVSRQSAEAAIEIAVAARAANVEIRIIDPFKPFLGVKVPELEAAAAKKALDDQARADAANAKVAPPAPAPVAMTDAPAKPSTRDPGTTGAPADTAGSDQSA